MKVQHNLPGFEEFHGVRFDVYAIDSEGRQYDIEFQNDSDGADPHRADFNAAMMTVRTLKKGENYSVLSERERVVIFITKTDVLKGGKPVYMIKRVIRELQKDFADGVLIVYVNTSHKDRDSALGKLIHDLRSRNVEAWYHNELQAKAQAIKKEDKGMGKAIDKLKADVREDERAITYENVARDLLRLGRNALEDIAKVCHMTLEQVQALADTVKA
ncbi:MAG: PD-(D/E)XK nuclease family transposase [Synergistaceae bacterium]|nr:PD-(D/E)XK nuclease family transposase [Synergistaceae bacterium]MBQ4400591.1 PD-(D/E)XK nuclease family transposase [Synergistaceae bacterium]MBQ6972003.1 PD-(D/E)XK nuclease family transposase [Synergistaceae bacterium]